MGMNAIVLLSGGLDSTAAMLWAKSQYKVVAMGFFYGQNAANELDVAEALCADLGVPWLRRRLGDVVPEPWGFAGRRPDGQPGAVMPARNLMMLAAATAEGATRWDGAFALVVGWNRHDAAAFPDCGVEFKELARIACGSAIGRPIELEAPWHYSSKAELISWAAKHDHLDIIRRTVSCYRGTRCSMCDACAERAAGFKAAGYEDH
jgi:7-cyano-7-deazaguanine synthase